MKILLLLVAASAAAFSQCPQRDSGLFLSLTPAGTVGVYQCSRFTPSLVWAAPAFADGEEPSGAKDGKNHVFTLAHTPAAAPVVTLNGVVQKPGADYTLAGSTITFAPKAAIPQSATENLLAWYRWQP